MNFKLLLFIKFKHVTLYLCYQKYGPLFFSPFSLFRSLFSRCCWNRDYILVTKFEKWMTWSCSNRFYIVKRRWETTLVGIEANLKRWQALSFLFFPNLKLYPDGCTVLGWMDDDVQTISDNLCRACAAVKLNNPVTGSQHMQVSNRLNGLSFHTRSIRTSTESRLNFAETELQKLYIGETEKR